MRKRPGGRGRTGADQDVSRPLLPRGKIESDTSEGGFRMVRELRCADLIPGCDFVAQGTRDSDVMQKTAEHAKHVHKMAAIAMEVEKKAREAIRDVVAV
ncbi:MAG: hypothetical protein DME05_22710 [Candidatus Rokuibacteriota bacterium]|nr:MAG: hypothetical protein DME05_22710 [Candidatus Rokubacteria bacterium]